MSKGFREHPLRRLWSSFGSLFPQGANGKEFELTIPSDYATVPYHLIIDQTTGLPAWAPFFTETFVILGPTILSGSQLFPPSVARVVTLGTIVSGSQLFPPTVSFTPTIAGATIASGSQLYPPTIVLGQVVDGGTIAAGSALYPPTLIAEQWVELGRATSPSSGKLTVSGLTLTGYSAVRIYINGVTVTTDDSSVGLRFFIAGSEISANYRWSGAKVAVGVTAADATDNSDPSISLTSATATQKVGNASTESLGAVVSVYQPGGSLFKRAAFRSGWVMPNGNTMTLFNGSGQLDDTGAITGFALVGSSDIVSGSMIVMGLA